MRRLLSPLAVLALLVPLAACGGDESSGDGGGSGGGQEVRSVRVGRNVYATQFHPELDVAGLVTRVRVYQHAGYFEPAEMNALIDTLTPAVVTEPGRLLANFVRVHARG